jgi:hypothetical protein
MKSRTASSPSAPQRLGAIKQFERLAVTVRNSLKQHDFIRMNDQNPSFLLRLKAMTTGEGQFRNSATSRRASEGRRWFSRAGAAD